MHFFNLGHKLGFSNPCYFTTQFQRPIQTMSSIDKKIKFEISMIYTI